MIIIAAVSLFLYSATPCFAEPSRSPAETSSESALAEHTGIGIWWEAGGAAVSVIPTLDTILGLAFTGDLFTLSPVAGFSYWFDLWPNLHDNYYISAGLEVINNRTDLGIRFLAFLPPSFQLPDLRVSADFFGLFSLYRGSRFSVAGRCGMGSFMIWSGDGLSQQLFRFTLALRLGWNFRGED